MRKIIVTATLASLALPIAPAMARTYSGWTVRATAMRAGPQYAYPAVRRIRRNARVDIYGCLNDWTWCDVGYRYDRGWVPGRDLVANYRGRRRGISSYLGIGVLTFIFGNYWDDHYRGRSFYNERSRWERHYNDNYQPHWGPRPKPAPIFPQRSGRPVQQGRPSAGHQNKVIAPVQPQEHRKVTPQPQSTPGSHKAFQGLQRNQGNQGNQGNNGTSQSGQHNKNKGNQGNKDKKDSSQSRQLDKNNGHNQ